MKKTLLLLTCIIGMLTSCSQDNDLEKGSADNNLKSEKVRWYGVKNSDEATTRGVADKDKLWNASAGITIKFLNEPTNPEIINKVKSIASQWENYAGIKFNFVESTQKASVRIAFDWEGNDYLTWSYTGTDAKFVRSQSQPTAVLGGLEYLSEQELEGDILRVFGQILGLEYEQRHQDWTFWKKESSLQAYWESMFGDISMYWDELRDYVFTPLNGENSIYPTQTAQIDEFSIMAWPYYTRAQSTKLVANYELSEQDKLFIGTLYPKPENTLPTIQKAWVDAGYFTWVDDTKTRLRLTELGAEQDTLPDVSDGEQLTSITSMFLHPNDNIYWDYDVKLRKAPKFNTSNITDFSDMFKRCLKLTIIPLYDTSKGTNFSGMFYSCHSLRIIPNLNTSKGTNFYAMFSACRSLVEAPYLDTSNGTNFSLMFDSCNSLDKVPNLDTSKGTIFIKMFYDCNLLTSVPYLNTSNGTNFEAMFGFCRYLKSIPNLDTSKGTNFLRMFNYCSSLQEKPNLDFSSVQDQTNEFGQKISGLTDMYKNTRFENN